MKNSIFQFMMIATLAFWVSGCKKKCVQNQVADLKFTAKDLGINPYSGTETMTFKSLAGDLLVLSAGGRQLDRRTVYQIDNETAKLDHDGCQGDYFTSDEDMMTFKTNPDDSMTFIYINLYFRYTFEYPVSDKNIFLFFYHGNHNSGFGGNFRFNNDSLFNYPAKLDSIVGYHSQVTIGPKTFTNIYELYSHNEDTRNTEWFPIAYYSLKDGFCGVKSNFGTVWYLDKK